MYTLTQFINRRFELWKKHGDIKKDKEYRVSVANHIIENKRKKIFKQMADDPSKFIELFFVVVNKERKTVPFRVNAVQRQFLTKVKIQKDKYKQGRANHIKFLILKGRQQGFTTIIEAYNLASAMTNKNFAGYVLADNSDNSQSIFNDKVKHPYDLMPKKIKPTEKYSNRRELLFQKEDGSGANSSIRVTTAGNKDAGRSKTLNFLHISEGAFVDNLHDLLTGLEEAMTKDSIQFIESTANGYNDFKELWDSDNNWINLFFEWWETPEYEMRFISSQQKDDFFERIRNAKETTNKDSDTLEWIYSRCKWLYEVKGLKLTQIHWYYNKWRDKGSAIKQEYPCTAKEAFIASGANYFNTENLDRQQMKNIKPIRTGYFEYDYAFDPVEEKKVIKDESIKFIEATKGSVKIYKEPKGRVGYSIGSDTATTGIDKNISQCIEPNGKQVAVISVANDEDLFADQTYCLGKMYNEALINMEVNHSTHPIKVLAEREYPNIYMRTNNPDATAERIQQNFGFRTTSSNRRSILGDLRELVRETPEKIVDDTTIDQMLTFIINDKGKPEAEEGKHDDAVLAYAIALHTTKQQISEEAKPTEALTGDYYRSELEDMGYTDWEIERYFNGEEVIKRG